MVDRETANILGTPSRRGFIRSMGLLFAAALPPRMARASSMQTILIVDGWILADTDFR